jgi:glycosyltransferase involved in cell wall biosynthesis
VITLHDTIQVTASNPFPIFRGFSGHKQWSIRAYSKWAINQSTRRADRIVTVSNFEKAQIASELNIDPERISVTHLAPNPLYKPAKPDEKDAWRPKLSAEFGIRGKYILGVGYEPRKNIQLLIESFRIIADEIEDLDLVIVCAAEHRRSYYQRFIEMLNLNHRVIILGSLAPQDLLVLYNLAEVFVFPSERESFGLPPLEAISCGTATIAMNLTSLPEVLGRGALLVDGKDPQVWASSIKQVLTNNALRLQLIECGLKQALSFSWQKCAIDTIRVYVDTLERSGIKEI